MQAGKPRLWLGWTLGAIFLFRPTLSAQQSSPLLPEAVKPCSIDLQTWERGNFKLPPNALQVAGIIGVECDIARLSELTTAKITYHSAPSLEELWLRQEITEAILTASLDAATVLSENDYEQEQIEELMKLSQVLRDRALRVTNLAIFTASTGLGIVAGAFSFSTRAPMNQEDERNLEAEKDLTAFPRYVPLASA